MTTVLITGAGAGFSREMAQRLAADGLDIIASVEITAQTHSLSEEASDFARREANVTDERDRLRAAQWDVDGLLNNAGISEGGSVVNIPEQNLRRQYEVEVIGPMWLAQAIPKKMMLKKKGKIIFMSSMNGLTTVPFAWAYSSYKHTMKQYRMRCTRKCWSFYIEAATVNPGPFLTGFYDRMFETWKTRQDDPSERLFGYNQLAFPHEQYDPESVYQTIFRVITGESDRYRNVEPKEIVDEQRRQIESAWERKTTDGLGHRHELVDTAYNIEPGAPV